ncbi:MAG: hypothetical protein WEB06_21665 [Actinomycetota bacterium]
MFALGRLERTEHESDILDAKAPRRGEQGTPPLGSPYGDRATIEFLGMSRDEAITD